MTPLLECSTAVKSVLKEFVAMSEATCYNG